VNLNLDIHYFRNGNEPHPAGVGVDVLRLIFQSFRNISFLQMSNHPGGVPILSQIFNREENNMNTNIQFPKLVRLQLREDYSKYPQALITDFLGRCPALSTFYVVMKRTFSRNILRALGQSSGTLKHIFLILKKAQHGRGFETLNEAQLALSSIFLCIISNQVWDPSHLELQLPAFLRTQTETLNTLLIFNKKNRVQLTLQLPQMKRLEVLCTNVSCRPSGPFGLDSGPYLPNLTSLHTGLIKSFIPNPENEPWIPMEDLEALHLMTIGYQVRYSLAQISMLRFWNLRNLSLDSALHSTVETIFRHLTTLEHLYIIYEDRNDEDLDALFTGLTNLPRAFNRVPQKLGLGQGTGTGTGYPATRRMVNCLSAAKPCILDMKSK
jgi:hypothetical protein